MVSIPILNLVNRRTPTVTVKSRSNNSQRKEVLMKHKKWLLIGIPSSLLLFVLIMVGKVAATETAGEFAQILEAGLNGFKAYLNWLLEVLKIVW